MQANHRGSNPVTFGRLDDEVRTQIFDRRRIVPEISSYSALYVKHACTYYM